MDKLTAGSIITDGLYFRRVMGVCEEVVFVSHASKDYHEAATRKQLDNKHLTKFQFSGKHGWRRALSS